MSGQDQETALDHERVMHQFELRESLDSRLECRIVPQIHELEENIINKILVQKPRLAYFTKNYLILTISISFRAPSISNCGRKTNQDRANFTQSVKNFCLRVTGDVFCDHKMTQGTMTSCMDNPFRNTFSIKGGQFVEKSSIEEEWSSIGDPEGGGV